MAASQSTSVACSGTRAAWSSDQRNALASLRPARYLSSAPKLVARARRCSGPSSRPWLRSGMPSARLHTPCTAARLGSPRRAWIPAASAPGRMTASGFSMRTRGADVSALPRFWPRPKPRLRPGRCTRTRPSLIPRRSSSDALSMTWISETSASSATAAMQSCSLDSGRPKATTTTATLRASRLGCRRAPNPSARLWPGSPDDAAAAV